VISNVQGVNLRVTGVVYITTGVLAISQNSDLGLHLSTQITSDVSAVSSNSDVDLGITNSLLSDIIIASQTSDISVSIAQFLSSDVTTISQCRDIQLGFYYDNMNLDDVVSFEIQTPILVFEKESIISEFTREVPNMAFIIPEK